MKILYVVNDMTHVEPLGVMQLSGISKQYGHKSVLGIAKEQDIIELIQKEEPGLVAVSALSTDANALKPIIDDIKVKFPSLTVIIGGPFPTFEPDMIDDWNVDAAVAGEGDLVFMDFLKAFEKGKDFSSIPNILTKKKKNALRPLIHDLDSLPYQDRELVYTEDRHLKYLNIKSFMASRGCAYSCAYCFNSAYNSKYKGKGKIVRRYSVDRIIDEIARVKKNYVMDFVRFGDDVFCYSLDSWLEEFSKKYRKKINLPFYCLLRPNLVSQDLINVLREAGLHSVSMSIEAGNEKLRKIVLNRDITNERLIKAFDMVHEAGVYTFVNSMIGLPNATIENELETLELNIRCKPSYPSSTIFTPFPGTRLGDKCFNEGLVSEDIPESTFTCSILNCFSKKEKKIQMNLLHLGLLAVRFPWLKKFIIKLIFYCPKNFLFFLIWYTVRNYLGSKYIWPIRIKLKHKIKLAFRVLKFELKTIKKNKS